MIGHAVVGWGLWALQEAAPLNPGELTDQQFGQRIALEAVRGRGASGNAVGILVPLGLFAMIVVLVWLGTRRRQAQIRATAEFHKQLLDKFGSGREFSEFLESPGGQKFMDELWSRDSRPREQILRVVRAGVVMAVLGLGLLGLTLLRRGFLIPGVIVLCLGAGFLISAAVSQYLSKKWASGGPGGPGAGSALTS
jgi:hypothetical protein